MLHSPRVKRERILTARELWLVSVFDEMLKTKVGGELESTGLQNRTLHVVVGQLAT